MNRTRSVLALVAVILLIFNVYVITKYIGAAGFFGTIASKPGYVGEPSGSDLLSSGDSRSNDVPVQKLEPLRLVQNVNCPLPGSGLVLQQYGSYSLRGAVESASPIESVKVVISRLDVSAGDGARVYELTPDAAALSCDFSGTQDSASKQTLDEMVKFAELAKGKYSFSVRAKNADGEKELYNGEFSVSWDHYQQLNPSNFRDNYSIALGFFGGDTQRFMFSFHLNEESRSINIEKEWREKYLTLTEIKGKKCYVHIDALPHIEQALDYADSSYVRVRGNGRDSGVIKLSSLIESFDGAYVPRLVRNDSFVSHHSFGTALDFNASRKPNTLSIQNRRTITDEVGQKLSYNGLESDGTITYYDFEYRGDFDVYYQNVPYSVINYLLYELAFYRADFGWGYYYKHNCDAMHFTLTELETSLHTADGIGLRKVFEYADAQA